VTALSGYSTAIMTMQYYAAKILRERAHPDRLRVFLQSTWHFRRAARHATWAALCLYLPAIGARERDDAPRRSETLTAQMRSHTRPDCWDG